MSTVQVIEKNGKPEYYIVPAALWNRVRAAVEDADDAAAFDRAVERDDGTRILSEVAFAIADGAHPVRAWREHRGLNQEALAVAAGLSKSFLSQIEGGKRVGTAATLRKLAAALDVPLAALT